ncbi:phosphatase PAP2 family protein [Streptomyces sp. HU2014]|uniref:phosphatase PAP2 family protein n=1 Tax=Streptomyces sp. HU2014 TaxID=2939414 RepID=UPI00200EE914|nr:phosphatase PAP2 family protein [Streptomyces sp. HU2014]UQI47604.1 phosphatase PAP2 family protein [Streptomyces sp. HU2014]
MNATPRPQETADTAAPALPQLRSGRAFAHTTGASGSGHPHRSDGRSPHTPRGARHPGPHGGPGTTPPVPGPPAWTRRGLFPALCVLLLAFLTWQTASHGPLRALDERLGRTVAHSGFPGGLARFLADLGNVTVALPVLLAAIAVSALATARARRGRRWWPPALGAALAMAAVPALVVPLKSWVGRPGPPEMAASGAHDGFFPSGHTATAAVAYGAATLLLLTATHAGRRPRALALGAYVLLNAGVGIGLVRCGYHWPLDVAGAWCLSGAVLWALALPLTRVTRADQPPGP